MSDVSVTIHGCRGSYPVTGPQFNRYGGATACVVVQIGDREIILDAGSGIIEYGRSLVINADDDEPLTRSLFFSHTHFDHLLGLPYFPPIFSPSSTLHLFGPRTHRYPSFEASIEALIRSPFYPVELHEMHAEKHFYDFSETEVVHFLKGDPKPVKVRAHHPAHRDQLPPADQIEVEVHTLRGYSHPKSGVSFYKVIGGGRTVVYATDTEGFVHGDQRLAAFAAGADLLIHDAMYTDAHYTAMPVPTQGYGHSTIQIAAELAVLAEVRQLCLFHHDPTSTDDHLDQVAERARELFANTVVARDGLIIAV